MMKRNPARAPAPSPRALERAGRDLRARDAAVTDDAALVAYLAQWERRLHRLQRSFPERWCVRGLSDQEVRDRLTLRLLEAVRRPEPGEHELRRPGKEWGLLIARGELRRMRASFRLPVSVGDVGEGVSLLEPPSQEQRWLELEHERGLALAQARAEQQLSRPQRRWLAALKLSARAGGLFQASSEPNLAAAARVLGKNRSSAQRGYRELQARFTRELERVR